MQTYVKITLLLRNNDVYTLYTTEEIADDERVLTGFIHGEARYISSPGPTRYIEPHHE